MSVKCLSSVWVSRSISDFDNYVSWKRLVVEQNGPKFGSQG